MNSNFPTSPDPVKERVIKDTLTQVKIMLNSSNVFNKTDASAFESNPDEDEQISKEFHESTTTYPHMLSDISETSIVPADTVSDVSRDGSTNSVVFIKAAIEIEQDLNILNNPATPTADLNETFLKSVSQYQSDKDARFFSYDDVKKMDDSYELIDSSNPLSKTEQLQTLEGILAGKRKEANESHKALHSESEDKQVKFADVLVSFDDVGLREEVDVVHEYVRDDSEDYILINANVSSETEVEVEDESDYERLAFLKLAQRNLFGDKLVKDNDKDVKVGQVADEMKKNGKKPTDLSNRVEEKADPSKLKKDGITSQNLSDLPNNEAKVSIEKVTEDEKKKEDRIDGAKPVEQTIDCSGTLDADLTNESLLNNYGVGFDSEIDSVDGSVASESLLKKVWKVVKSNNEVVETILKNQEVDTILLMEKINESLARNNELVRKNEIANLELIKHLKTKINEYEAELENNGKEVLEACDRANYYHRTVLELCVECGKILPADASRQINDPRYGEEYFEPFATKNKDPSKYTSTGSLLDMQNKRITIERVERCHNQSSTLQKIGSLLSPRREKDRNHPSMPTHNKGEEGPNCQSMAISEATFIPSFLPPPMASGQEVLKAGKVAKSSKRMNPIKKIRDSFKRKPGDKPLISKASSNK
uniref:Fibronectin type-III domain-containing protein n=1 Tax=Rhabditophanes sp. KR3021 TaxID=114890 RepID=A0AC35TMY1_9BILA